MNVAKMFLKHLIAFVVLAAATAEDECYNRWPRKNVTVAQFAGHWKLHSATIQTPNCVKLMVEPTSDDTFDFEDQDQKLFIVGRGIIINNLVAMEVDGKDFNTYTIIAADDNYKNYGIIFICKTVNGKVEETYETIIRPDVDDSKLEEETVQLEKELGISLYRGLFTDEECKEYYDKD